MSKTYRKFSYSSLFAPTQHGVIIFENHEHVATMMVTGEHETTYEAFDDMEEIMTFFGVVQESGTVEHIDSEQMNRYEQKRIG